MPLVCSTDDETVLGIGERDRRQRAAVAERARRRVTAHGEGVDREPEAPVALRVERLVVEADAVARGDRLDRLRREDTVTVELAAPEQRLVETRQLAHRAAPTAAGDAPPEEVGAVEVVERHRAAPGAVLCMVPMRSPYVGDPLGRHAHPAVGHAERLEDLVAHVLLEARDRRTGARSRRAGSSRS